MSEFKREMDRYVVLKRTDIDGSFSAQDKYDLMTLCERAEEYRKDQDKLPLHCVLIESDWPEYEIVWQMLEDRFTGKTSPNTNLI